MEGRPRKRIKTSGISLQESKGDEERIFQHLCILLVEKEIGRVQAGILKKNVEKRGGVIEGILSKKTTQIVATSYQNVLKALKLENLSPAETSNFNPSIPHIGRTSIPSHQEKWNTNPIVQSHNVQIKVTPPNASLKQEFNEHPQTKKQELCSEAGIPLCYHNQPAILRKVQKEGENTGKLFYSCNQSFPQKKCKFFQWDNSASTLASKRKKPESFSRTTLSTEQQKPEPLTTASYSKQMVSTSEQKEPQAFPIAAQEVKSSWLYYSSEEETMKEEGLPSFVELLNLPIPSHKFDRCPSPVSVDFPHTPSLSPSLSLESSQGILLDDTDTGNSSPSAISPPVSPLDNYDEDKDTILESIVAKVAKPGTNQGWRASFACQKTKEAIKQQESSNANRDITDILEVLEAKSMNTGEKWRAFAYKKAITAIKQYPRKITTLEEAKTIRGVGGRIADKIGEILNTGKLRQAEYVQSDKTLEAVNLFGKVWGAGPTTVTKWISQGFRTLDDLKNANLNSQQKIGLKHYNELQMRIPREEVKELEIIVKQQLLLVDSNLKLVTAGSYRRKKKDCGDVDMLITHKKGFSVERVLSPLINRLHAIGFLTDDLTSSWETENSYMGICKLPDGIHRRIDLRCYPLNEWPCALLYFTGSGHFNRSMRLWARKHGFQLSDHHVVRRFTEDLVGDPISVKTEEDIFKVLGLEYKSPEDRDI